MRKSHGWGWDPTLWKENEEMKKKFGKWGLFAGPTNPVGKSFTTPTGPKTLRSRRTRSTPKRWMVSPTQTSWPQRPESSIRSATSFHWFHNRGTSAKLVERLQQGALWWHDRSGQAHGCVHHAHEPLHLWRRDPMASVPHVVEGRGPELVY